MDLKNKLVTGGAYLAITNLLGQLFAVFINVMLARLLNPDDFGLIALSSTFIGFVALFSSVGFGSAIIYYREMNRAQISSLYWINWIFSILTFALVFFSTSWAADFYQQPRLVSIVRWSSLSILISPIFIVNYKIMEREMKFKLLSILNMIATFCGGLTGVVAAFNGFGVYSLVVQLLISISIRAILINLYEHWRPLFYIKYSEVKLMFWYSVKYKLANSIQYIERNVDYLILGKIFNAKVLGHYSFAYNIMYTPVKRISYIFSNLLFPALSSIKDDTNALIKAYFKSNQLIAMVSFPLMTLLSFNADWLIPLIFGDQWIEAIPIIQILCFAGAIQSISQVGGVVFPSIGKPEISIYLSVIRTIFTIMAILIGSYYGILEVAYGLVIAKALSFVITLVMINYHIPYSVLQLIKLFIGTAVNVILLFMINWLIQLGNYQIYDLSKFLLMSGISALIILLFYYKIILQLLKIILNKTSTAQIDKT